MQTVADEHQGSGYRFRLRAAGAENRVVPDRKRLFAAVDDKSQRTFVSQNSGYVELDGLIVTFHARRLETRGVELGDHVSRSTQIAFGTGETAFHAFVGKGLYVSPPRLAGSLVGGSLRSAL